MADRLRDARTLWHLARPARRGRHHADRLEAFYRDQASDYDRFRERLLPGRRELIEALPLEPGMTWVDLGGGTARNLLFAGPRLAGLRRVVVVDLCPSLLGVARHRARSHGWSRVDLVRADAGRLPLPPGIADVVTCSYSLTMMPDWRAALDAARAVLRPGGTFAAVDFYVSGGAADPDMRTHGWWTRRWCPWWFRHSGVMLDADRLMTLSRQFSAVRRTESLARLPYLPGARVPYYTFIGRAL